MRRALAGLFIASLLVILSGLASAQAKASGAREYPTVAVGDTLQIAFSMPTADQACLKPIGNLRLVVQQCTRAGGLVFLRIYTTRGGLTLNAIAADSVSVATAAQLATMTTMCDSALVAIGFRGDSALVPAALPSPACDAYRARIQASIDSVKAATKPPD